MRHAPVLGAAERDGVAMASACASVAQHEEARLSGAGQLQRLADLVLGALGDHMPTVKRLPSGSSQWQNTAVCACSTPKLRR
jgi:hypothetical protein